MLKEVLICLGLATVAPAMPDPVYHGYGYPGPFGYNGGYYGYPFFYPGYMFGYPFYPYPPLGAPSASKLVFHGTFKGSCDGAKDGLYYVDDKSFAFCSHGQKTVQPCAEGSANPPLEHFKDGTYYGFYEFCSINLVAKGYPTGYFPHPPVYHKVDAGYNEANDGYYASDAGYHGDAPGYPPKPVQGYTEEVHSVNADGSYGYKKEEVKYTD